MAMAGPMVVEIKVADMPEVLARMRGEMAGLIREAADAEAYPQVARRLREVAAVFETGKTGLGDAG